MADNVVDKEAREQIKRLERRLEGAHLTPSVWQISKQTLQAVFSWTGWEIFGIGFFIILGVFLIALIVFGFEGGCTARHIEMNQRQYQPTCERLGGTFTSHNASSGRITCALSDRIIVVDPNDLNDTEVFMLNEADIAGEASGQ